MQRGVSRVGSAVLVAVLAWGCTGDPGAARGGAGEAALALPEGFALRLDRSNRDPSKFAVRAGVGGIEIQTGPSGILYRPEDAVQAGPYRLSAEFTEIDAPRGHREGFGLFIGGEDLAGPNHRYTYFLVRADGRFLIKTRAGATTHEVSDGWVESDAVRTAGEGDVVNDLSIEVGDELVAFLCNGELVGQVPVVQVEAHGVVGLRVNHNLSLGVVGFRIEP